MKGDNMTKATFWEKIYVDGDMDMDDHSGKWYSNPKYVNEPPHVFVREDLVAPKPSTDFSVPKENLGEYFLFYHKYHKQWYIGDVELYGEKCYMVDVELFDLVPLSDFSHWLPMPTHPTDD